MLHHLLGCQIGVGVVSFESVPADVIYYLLLADLYRDILAYLEKLVVASAVDLSLGQGAAAVGLA